MHRGERLIEREEPFASEQVLDSLRASGVDVRLQTAVPRVSRAPTPCCSSSTTARSSRRTSCSPRSAGRPARAASGSTSLGLAEERPARGRRRPARAWPRLAVRRRRRQRPGAADAHGQVPGPPRRGLDRGPRRAPALGRRALPARDLHRPSGRRGRPHARRRARRRGCTSAHVEVETGGNAGGSFIGRGAPGTARMIVDEERRVARRLHRDGCRDRRVAARGDDRDRRGDPARRPLARGAVPSRPAASSGCACSRRTGYEGHAAERRR